jgi:hypothetical protein
MTTDIDRELIQLQRLTTVQLRQRYLDTLGEAAHSSNKTWLIKRIAWRLQALAEGDLSARARQRAALLARDADLRLSPPRSAQLRLSVTAPHQAEAPVGSTPQTHDPRLPPPGSLLTRSYKGQAVEVKVLTQGFQYQGRVFSSLSALAKEITGTHCSGFRFFGLGRHAQGGNP